MKIIDISANTLCAEDTNFSKGRFLGTHILCELHDCDETILDNADVIEEIMLSAAEKCGSTILKQSFHKFSPQGVSGILLIQESHLSIHTWPEFGYAAVDMFTCSPITEGNVKEIADFLKVSLGSKRFSVFLVKRGKILHDSQ
jgi:S-adenosylmethionine decarboxylase